MNFNSDIPRSHSRISMVEHILSITNTVQAMANHQVIKTRYRDASHRAIALRFMLSYDISVLNKSREEPTARSAFRRTSHHEYPRS